MAKNALQVDTWVWGTETIIWGFDPAHQYTFKVLAPKRGRDGCLSLQYHHEKSESWLQYRGTSWALLVIDGEVCTRLLRPGSLQNIPTGTIHRLMGVTDDCMVLEPSTPDKHAADKSVPKDVVRLHCTLGREVSAPRNDVEKSIIDRAIEVTEEACRAIAQGQMPKEYNLDKLLGISGFELPTNAA